MTWPDRIHSTASATFTHHLPPSLAVGLISPALTGLAFVLLLGVAAIGVVRVARGGKAPTARMVVAAGMWLAATALLTLRPGHSGRLNLVPFDFGANSTPYEPVSNVLLFVPLGILVAALGWRWFAVLGLGLAISLCIEATQYLLNIGRTADVNDVIENTLGTLVGWLVVVILSRLTLRHRAAP